MLVFPLISTLHSYPLSSKVSFNILIDQGQTLNLVSTCDKIGKNLAFTRLEVLSGDQLVARGSHTKFLKV